MIQGEKKSCSSDKLEKDETREVGNKQSGIKNVVFYPKSPT